jgi:hypothetical protein
VQRYHTNPMGTNKGIDAGIMRPADAGCWVLYQDAIEEIERAKSRALATGRAEGQTKLDAYKSINQTPELDGVTLHRTGSGDVGVYDLRDTDFVGYRGSLGLLRVSTLKGHEAAAGTANPEMDSATFGRMQRFVADQADRIAERDQTDKLTKQLLNELYHDRARLEKVVQDAVAVIQKAYNQMFDIDTTSVIENEWHYTMGQMSQFVDTHGDQS